MSLTPRLLAGALIALAIPAAAQAVDFTSWSAPLNAEDVPGTSDQLNTPNHLDGCPIQSPDGLSLYMASTRPRFEGDTRTDIDIWVARRESAGEPWGAPENLGPDVNSTADDFCPTPVRGKGLFFISRRVTPGVTCGMGDLYFTRFNRKHGWRDPGHLACEADGGPNTARDEQGPSYFEAGSGSYLYYSSGPDIYVSRRDGDGDFGVGQAVAELNTSASDIQPNVRKDGREIVFASNRILANGQDIWTSTRDSVDDPWSPPVNVSAVNTTENETRPSLSWDARTLYFGRAPGGPNTGNIWFSTRERANGS